MHMKILAALIVCVAAAAPATAGEIKGNGDRIAARETSPSSICSYSGLNDELYDTEWDEYDADAPRVQSFGQDVRGLRGAFAFNPGDAC